MEKLSEFLETSTIHGLSYISTTRRLIRLIWILIVIGGFSGACFLIFLSFKDWDENPISTTIETLPIESVTFPEVTVCPPANTLTNLNYDLMKNEGKYLEDDVKAELKDHTLKLVNEIEFNKFMSLFEIVDLENKYLNWYRGIDTLVTPYIDPKGLSKWSIETTAIRGLAVTKNFGQDYRPNFDKRVDFNLELKVPRSWTNKENIYPLNITIEKMTSESYHLRFRGAPVKYDTGESMKMISILDPHRHGGSKLKYFIDLSEEYVENIELDKMFGFRFTWNASVDPSIVADNPHPQEKDFYRR